MADEPKKPIMKLTLSIDQVSAAISEYVKNHALIPVKGDHSARLNWNLTVNSVDIIIELKPSPAPPQVPPPETPTDPSKVN